MIIKTREDPCIKHVHVHVCLKMMYMQIHTCIISHRDKANPTNDSNMYDETH